MTTQETEQTQEIQIILGKHYIQDGKACWDPEVVESINRVSPTFIVLDGLGITPEWYNQQQVGWIKLPVNEREATFLRGDPYLYTAFVPNLPEDKMELVLKHDISSNDILYLSEMIGPLIVGATALSTLKASTMSRRHFLKGSAITAASLMLGISVIRGGSGIFSNFTKDPNNQIGRVFQATMPIIAQQDWWLNGRTAVLVSKAIEYSKENLIQGAVVLGGRHMANLYEIQNDPRIRQMWIKNFITTAVSNIIKILPSNTQYDVERLKNNVLSYVACYDVCKYGCYNQEDKYLKTVSTQFCQEILQA